MEGKNISDGNITHHPNSQSSWVVLRWANRPVGLTMGYSPILLVFREPTVLEMHRSGKWPSACTSSLRAAPRNPRPRPDSEVAQGRKQKKEAKGHGKRGKQMGFGTLLPVPLKQTPQEAPPNKDRQKRNLMHIGKSGGVPWFTGKVSRCGFPRNHQRNQHGDQRKQGSRVDSWVCVSTFGMDFSMGLICFGCPLQPKRGRGSLEKRNHHCGSPNKEHTNK